MSHVADDLETLADAVRSVEERGAVVEGIDVDEEFENVDLDEATDAEEGQDDTDEPVDDEDMTFGERVEAHREEP